MSTIFNIRNLRLPNLSRASVIIGSVVVVLALAAAFVGWNVYHKLTNNTVVVYFTAANALYTGDKVQIMGVRVGSIDKIEPAGDKMKVTFHYENKYQVPAQVNAVVLNPSLVASRAIQLEPPYKGGPVLADNAVIPIERTQIPVEWDELRNQVTKIVDQFGPTPEQPKGPFGEVIESVADGLAGKGKQFNTTLNNLSAALTTLNEGRGDFLSVVHSLAVFVDALHENDQQFVALNTNLAQFTGHLAHSDSELAATIKKFDGLLTTTHNFLDQNGPLATHVVNNLAEATNTLLQPDSFNGLETALHVLPTLVSNLANFYYPAHGGVAALPAITNFANPLEFICSTIQAGSRLGYQDSAELCAQYLAPVLDAVKLNYLPFGVNLFNSAATTPKEIAYSEPRLQPPNGYKDSTVPGIWVPDTPLSHRNTQRGWVVAPGMQGVQVDPVTSSLLTPESLAELMGGPDIAPPVSGLQTPPGAPNSYDESVGPAPYIGQPGNPMPIGPPPPGPDVIPGPVAPTPAPAGPLLPAESPLAADLNAPAGPGQ